MLSERISANRIILSDLCPNSIVKRTVFKDRRQDNSDQPGGVRAPVFCKYVEDQTVESWTRRRIEESGTERIIALGRIAEHGLLRLFKRQGAMISCNGPPLNRTPQYVNESICWVDRYYDPDRKLNYWLTPGRWWKIAMPGRKDMRLLPVCHPAAVDNCDYDRDYKLIGKALAVWLAR